MLIEKLIESRFFFVETTMVSMQNVAVGFAPEREVLRAHWGCPHNKRSLMLRNHASASSTRRRIFNSYRSPPKKHSKALFLRDCLIPSLLSQRDVGLLDSSMPAFVNDLTGMLLSLNLEESDSVDLEYVFEGK